MQCVQCSAYQQGRGNNQRDCRNYSLPPVIELTADRISESELTDGIPEYISNWQLIGLAKAEYFNDGQAARASIKSATFPITVFSAFKPWFENNMTSPPWSPPAPPSSPSPASSWRSPAPQQQQLFSPVQLLQQRLSSPPPSALPAGVAGGRRSAPGPAHQGFRETQGKQRPKGKPVRFYIVKHFKILYDMGWHLYIVSQDMARTNIVWKFSLFSWALPRSLRRDLCQGLKWGGGTSPSGPAWLMVMIMFKMMPN